MIGLIPAAGRATRLRRLPCSKEIYPIGLGDAEHRGPKVAAEYLLDGIAAAGVEKTYFVIRDGKWDIPAYFGDGRAINLQLAYLMADENGGTPYSLDQAYPFVRNALVVTGFADVVFTPADMLVELLGRQASTGADVVLGAVPASSPHKVDMIQMDARNRVTQIVIKPARTRLKYSWITAAWTPRFTEFMHDFLKTRRAAEYGREIFVGDVIRAAIDVELTVEAVPFPNGTAIDVGTPAELVEAVRAQMPSEESTRD